MAKKLIIDFSGPTTASLTANANEALGALLAFVELILSQVDDRHGISLDTADPLVSEVEAFVKAYHELYGSPVR